MRMHTPDGLASRAELQPFETHEGGCNLGHHLKDPLYKFALQTPPTPSTVFSGTKDLFPTEAVEPFLAGLEQVVPIARKSSPTPNTTSFLILKAP